MPAFVKELWAKAKRHPVILTLGVIALLAELAYATVNQSAIPPYIDRELKLPAGWLGWIMNTFLLVEALARPGLGALGDRIGRRPLIIVGPLASCVSALLMTQAANPACILVLRALDGLGAAAMWPAVFALVGDTIDEGNRSQAMSVLNVTYMVGIALGPLLGGVIADYTHTQRYVFLAVAVIFSLTFLVAFLRLPKHTAPHAHDAACPDHPTEYRLSNLLYSLRAMPQMLVMVFLAFLAIGVLIPVAKLYAMDELKLSESQFGALLLPVAGALALLALPLGRLGDKWGKVESVRLGVMLTAVAMWLFTGVKLAAAIVVAGSVLGIGFLIAMPAWFALISNLTSSTNRGQILGAVGMAQGLGAMLGVFAGDHLYHGKFHINGVEQHSSPLFLAAGLLTLSALLTFIFLKKPKPAEESSAR